MKRKASGQLSEQNQEILNRVAQANGRLRAGKTGIVIEVRANRYVLRGTLPPKPGSDRAPHQQRLATGVLANLANLPSVERLARRVSLDVAEGRFRWPEEEINGEKTAQARAPTVADWIERFELHYWATHEKTEQAQQTFRKDYLRALRELPSDQALTPRVIKTAVERTPPNSRLRGRFTMALTCLARFAGIDADLRGYKPKQREKRLEPRDLPTDEEILRWWGELQLLAPGWAYLYALMACYGLRPGEVWFADRDNLDPSCPLLSITQGKTGPRSGILCLYPEWFEVMEIGQGDPPPMTRDKNPGTPLSRVFRKYGIPFDPYALRHAWAGRAALHGIETGSAALQMGHSVKIHLDYYSHWYGARHQRQVWQLLLDRSDRPKAPTDREGLRNSREKGRSPAEEEQ